MSWQVALSLGRVSNLPTVWTNMLAGVALTSTVVFDWHLVGLALALSLFYVGGMYLNDAFDAEIDAKERPERPIPSGRIGRASVFRLGFGMLGLGLAGLALLGWGRADGTGFWPVLGGVLLAAAIIFYDWHHKANPYGPLVMGLCRMFVYLTAGWSVAVALPPALFIGAVLLLSYLIGLTYVAKQENLGRVANMWPLLFLAAPVIYGATLIPGNNLLLACWAALVVLILVALRFVMRRGPGDIPRAVVSLIAGISLLDALLIASTGAAGAALLAGAGFVLTLVLQKYVAGT